MHYELKAFLFMHVKKVGIEITRFFYKFTYKTIYSNYKMVFRPFSVSAVDFAAILIT